LKEARSGVKQKKKAIKKCFIEVTREKCPSLTSPDPYNLLSINTYFK